MGFFEGFSAAEIIGAIILIAGFFYPGFGVKLMNLVKEKIGLEGRQANLLIMILLAGVSAAALAVTGYFAGFDVTAANLVALWGVCYAMAQDAYNRIFKNAPGL